MKNFFLFLAIALFTFPTFSQSIENLRLKTVDGKRFEIKNHLGEGPVLVSFWATWCKPCRKELPALKSVFDKYEKNGLKIIAISQDSPRSLSNVKAYVKTSGLPYIFLLDPNGELSTKLAVKDIPYTLLADETGKVVYSHRGYREGDELKLEEKIVEMIPEKENNKN